VWSLSALDACQGTINVLPCGGRSRKRCHHSHRHLRSLLVPCISPLSKGGAPKDRIRSALLRHSRDGPSAALGFSRPKKNFSDGWDWCGLVAKELMLFLGPCPDPLMDLGAPNLMSDVAQL
jgi:hypothetical protein